VECPGRSRLSDFNITGPLPLGIVKVFAVALISVSVLVSVSLWL